MSDVIQIDSHRKQPDDWCCWKCGWVILDFEKRLLRYPALSMCGRCHEVPVTEFQVIPPLFPKTIELDPVTS